MKFMLIIGIISTIIYMLYVVYDGYTYFADIPTLVSSYAAIPVPERRTVIVIPCEKDVSVLTVKSLLVQSKRVNDIGVEIASGKVPDEIKNVVSVHKPGTLFLREPERDTIVITAENGKWYDYDFVERNIDQANLKTSDGPSTN